MRRYVILCAAVAAIVGLAGCTPKFAAEPTGKKKGADAVQVKFKICTRDSEGCPPDEKVPERPRGGEEPVELHHLIALRVPKGTKAPKRIKGTGPEVVRYDLNASFGRGLNKEKLGKGKWFGYVSRAIGGASKARYKIKLGLPKNPGSTFKWQAITGYGNFAEGDKIRCSDGGFKHSGSGNAQCLSDPQTRRDARKSLKIKLK